MVLPLLAALIGVAAGSALLHHRMYHSGGVFLTLGLLALGGLGNGRGARLTNRLSSLLVLIVPAFMLIFQRELLISRL